MIKLYVISRLYWDLLYGVITLTDFLCLEQRKRKLDTEGVDESDAPPPKVPRPSSPKSFGPGEIFFKVDEKTKYVWAGFYLVACMFVIIMWHWTWIAGLHCLPWLEALCIYRKLQTSRIKAHCTTFRSRCAYFYITCLISIVVLA